MAEEKLGTLQYDMLVDQKKLEQQLDDITKKLQEKDKQWKEILSGQGNIVSPKINVADLGNLTKANEAVSSSLTGLNVTWRQFVKERMSEYMKLEGGHAGAMKRMSIEWKEYQQSLTVNNTGSIIKSNVDVATSMALLEKEIKAETIALKGLSDQELRSATNQAKLSELQKKIDLYAQFKESLNEATKARKQEDSDAKRKAINDEKEIERTKRLTEAQKAKRSALVSEYTNAPQGSVDQLAAGTKVLKFDRRVADERTEIDRLNRLINTNEAARKKLIATQKEQEQQQIKNLRLQKLQANIEVEQVGSIARLRAEYAKLKFQSLDEKDINKFKQMSTQMSALKSEIQALQPTLGIWGKLTSAIRTYATAYLSVQAVLGLGRAVYGQTKELDSLNFSMKTVIKSSTELAQTQKFLSDVAVNYGGDLLTLSERYVKFRAAALQSNMSAGETQKIYESVSKAAGTLGLKTDELSGVYLALEQMISKGKVSTEELRRQLGERLPGAFGIMANALGKTVPELDKMLKKGEVLSSEALPKFAAALEKAYGIESLKKIDTLAAAQGRLSTEFTGLIKSLGASDTFKNTINAMASFIGFVKDNIGVIGLFAKSIAVVTLAVVANRIATTIFVGVQKLSVILTGSQIAKMTQLTAAQLASAEATWVNVRATSALSNTFKTFGGWVSIVVNALVGIAAYFLIFNKQTKETADAMAQLNKEIGNQKDIVYNANKVLSNAKVGTEQYKEALQQLNTIALKYNQTLLTEKNTRAEVNTSAAQTLRNLDLEYLKKKKVIELEGANTAVAASTDPLQAKLFELYQNLPGGAEKAVLAYKEFVQQMKDGEDGFSSLSERIRKEFGTTADVVIRPLIKDALNGLLVFEKELARINANYPADKVAKKLFDIAEIDKAKKAFEEFQKLKSQGAANLYSGGFVGSDAQTFEDWLRNQIKSLSTSTAEIEKNKDALTALYIALAEADKKGQPAEDRQKRLMENRKEAIRKLNDKYLADQEDFANYEMGIQSTRIANMEDGLDKEIKLNELAYENRIKAIEKEKIATIKLLNEAAGVKGKIVGFDATGYSQEVQDAVNSARDSDLQKRKNAENDLRESNLKSEKDYQIKINEIRRDANDQFLSGLEKERAAINEKYDEWVRKAGTNMKLIAEIEKGRDVALSEIYIQNQIDQLDFAREIEYKKNEIRLSGSARQRKLEKENFEVYVKYERERIKLLKSSVSVDKQREGFNKEQQLAADEALLKIKQQQELESDILEGAQKISEEYIKQAGLTGESAENLQLAVSTLQSIAKGDYLSAALGVLSKIFTSFSTENENEMLDYFEQLKVKISAVVDKISTLNSVLAKMGSTSSVIGVKLLQSEMAKLANDAARLNEQLKEIAASDEGRRRGAIIQGATTNGGRSDATEIESSRKRIVTDLIKQTDYLNQQIIMLSNKLLDPNLTEDQRKAVESVLNGYIEIVDAIDASIQSITGTSINELSNSIVDAFLAGENAAEAWGNKVTDIIRYMVKQQLVAQLLTKPITQAIQTLVADSEDTLTPEEALKFKDTIRGITEDVSPAIAAAAEAMKQVGIDLSSATTSSGISKGIQALTEDTGRRLEGLINSIRESGVINIGNTKQLVESSQMIQGYAAQSLGHLRNIDATTAAQLTLFNEIMTSASGTGGKGIKVYVQ